MARRGFSLLAVGLALAGFGAAAHAQSPALAPAPAPAPAAEMPATLIADSVTYDRETRQLTATGDVQVLYQGRVLSARAIVYDEASGEIRATGPITLSDPSTRGVLLAGDAALTPDLRDGLIESAQVLIGNQLQVAAAEARRSSGRYTTLYRTVASSCRICEGSSTPTWSLRASRVTQDTEARRIYFENTTLQLFGVPVAWVPRMSIPDPSVGRASGVLVPMAQHSEIYGLGVKVPYYRVLGPSTDATLTPFLTTTGAKLLEGEFRQRFDSGGYDFNGVFAFDDGMGGNFRGAAFSTGAFALPDFGFGAGFTTDFDLAVASDDAFLQQFDYSDADLLTSFARVTRTRPNDYVEMGAIAFQSLREDQSSSTLPIVPLDFVYRSLITPKGIGGQLGLEAQGLSLVRADGQDVLRVGGDVDWRRQWTLPQGILASAGALAGFDVYRVWDDPSEPDSAMFRADPNVNIELRWPFARSTATAAGVVSHVIEPILQVIYSDTIGESDVPNNDSTLVEFDANNLFAINRFPGEDRVETGLRANYGVTYTRYDPAGWSLGATVGQVVRAEPDDAFYESTGLSGKWSDVVAALQLNIGTQLSLVDRALFGTDLDFNRNEFSMTYTGEVGGVRASYVYLAQADNPYYGPQPETNEFGLDARYQVTPNWALRGLWRYDAVTNQNLRAGGGVTYANDCAEFDLSVSRRYTSSTNVPPSTSVGFSLRLAGLGGQSETEWPARACARPS